jgi:hypothetical protein
MAEPGFVEFATIALPVGQAPLAAYRSKFSKRQRTQPQLLAILCLMRDEDWTVREPKSGWPNPWSCAPPCGCGTCPIIPRFTAFSAGSTGRPLSAP